MMFDDVHVVLSNAILNPIAWWRYIDDIFMIWTHGWETLQQFEDYANNFHPSIKFVFEKSDSEVNFLDTRISKHGANLSTDLYTKPTDTRQYLHFTSCHPIEHRLPIAYSQALRIRRICSDDLQARHHLYDLEDALVRRGYPRGRVQNQIRKALSKDRKLLLEKNSKENISPTPTWIAPYHPSTYADIKFIAKKHEHFLVGTGITAKLWWKPPRKLNSHLVSSRLYDKTDNASFNNIGIVSSCNNSRCKTCAMLSTETDVLSPITGLFYNIKAAKTTCTS